MSSWRRGRSRAALSVVLASTAISVCSSGCGGAPRVVRVYDGRIVDGPYVPAEAYASYLRGALADEAGDLKRALSAYEDAVGEDDEDPEIFTRIADVRCRLDPRDEKADEALSKALKLDGTYAPAFAARARCAASRGRPDEAASAAREAARHDPANVDMQALVVRVAPTSRESRERALALTAAHGERVSAWDALVHWGRARGDAELVARGLEGLVRVAPMRAAEVENGAIELVGLGFTEYGRRVAAAVADVPQDHGGTGPRNASVARLAVDEALLRDDHAAAERRAVRGHVPLSEVAARAVVLGHRDLGARLAHDVIQADPASRGAQMVLSALAAPGKPAAPVRSDGAPAEGCVLLLADAIATTSNNEAARAWFTGTERTPMALHDPTFGPLAVDLAARGVLAAEDLPVELRIELAARRREPPPAMSGAAAGVVDVKHTFLWHVLVDATGREARALYDRLAPALDRDVVVGYAVSRYLLTVGPPPADGTYPWEMVRRAIAAAPRHPLLLAVAVELAKKSGRPDELTPARARLLAVARTPAERALASE